MRFVGSVGVCREYKGCVESAEGGGGITVVKRVYVVCEERKRCVESVGGVLGCRGCAGVSLINTQRIVNYICVKLISILYVTDTVALLGKLFP